MEPNISLIESNTTEDFSIKIVVVGDSGVGKSNILSRFVKNEFIQESKATVGVELSVKTYRIDNKVVKVHLWDTAGQERYKSITSAYYKGAKGAMIVYDITRRDTYNAVEKWYEEVKEFADKNISVMLVGNKSDLTLLRNVETHEVMNKAKLLGITNKVIRRNTMYGDISRKFR